jgi:hypothetical protein
MPFLPFPGDGSNLDEDDTERPKRVGHLAPVRVRAPVPVRRNGREIGLAAAGPILDPVDTTGGSAHSLQDLAQATDAIKTFGSLFKACLHVRF